MTIYATYADLDVNRAKIVAEIGEVDEWLKGKKGYGALGVGANIRRLIAAMLVLEDYQEENTAMVSTTNAVAQAVIEELVLILISIIVTSIIVSSVTSSNH